MKNIKLKNELLKLFYEANKNFLINHMSNILNDVSERNLCAQLSMEINLLLKKYDFQGYYSDPEYNRNGLDVKKTICAVGLEPQAIVCDLIVHSRGEKQKDNLLAIEMKKTNNCDENDINNDRARLKALTKQECDEYFELGENLFPKNVCLYELGIMYILDIRRKLITYEIYVDGEKVGDETDSFDEMMNYTEDSFKFL